MYSYKFQLLGPENQKTILLQYILSILYFHSNFYFVYVFSFRLGVYFTLAHSWCWILPIWSFSLDWICSESTRYYPLLNSLTSLLSVFTLSCYSYRCVSCLQCIIDLKENVLRVGGGEVSVPFLQGLHSYFFNSILYWLYINIYWASWLSCSEKDIPSRFLDEEKYAKEASGSGGQVSILLIISFSLSNWVETVMLYSASRIKCCHCS